jgi:hypothetical protein
MAFDIITIKFWNCDFSFWSCSFTGVRKRGAFLFDGEWVVVFVH